MFFQLPCLIIASLIAFSPGSSRQIEFPFGTGQALLKIPVNSALPNCPAVCNTVLSGIAHYFFIFCMKIRFNKHMKATNPVQDHSRYAQNLVYEAFWIPELTFLNLSRNLLHFF